MSDVAPRLLALVVRLCLGAPGLPGALPFLLSEPKPSPFPSLKTCTVSLAELIASNVAVALKAMLNILVGIDPRRNCANFLPSGTEKTRMIVPLSLAVANRVPEESKHK